MKNNRITGIILVLAALLAHPVNALDSGVENLRQTGKAFASVA